MVVSIKTGFYAEMETDMKKLENKCMLITYSDSMGHNLADLNKILDKYFKNAVGGIHILPFFPSSGDRGFAPMDYHKVVKLSRIKRFAVSDLQLISICSSSNVHHTFSDVPSAKCASTYGARGFLL